ncbi:MAG: BT_3928 family protein [Ginsengibacter sp.]
MRTLVNVARVFVGLLFIFSGLVKANDPLGLSYKMQEFFEVWSQYPSLKGLMSWLNDFALPFSIITITLEIIVGVAIILGWNKRFFSLLLLVLIVFFTFLTGYAVFSGKIATCGCFGDCIPLTAMQSFMKDLLLFVLILIICAGVKYIQPVFTPGINSLIILISTVIVIFFQWYALRHLPVKDCLPYKVGNNILELRKMPSNAVPDKVDFKFTYEKNGQKKQFSKNELPDSTWTFVSREDVVIEKGKNNEPPIKDFFISTLSGTDTTESLLNQANEYYIFFIKDLQGTGRWLTNFTSLYTFAKQKNRPIVVVASQAGDADQYFNHTNNFSLPVLSCDATALKTAARTNPTLYLMKGPVIEKKWGWADLQKAAK